jgi:hypothetical protein
VDLWGLDVVEIAGRCWQKQIFQEAHRQVCGNLAVRKWFFSGFHELGRF